MGMPFSSEVKNIATDAASFKSHATTALYALVIITFIHTILLCTFLLGILITGNPDLAEERNRFVTPAVKSVVKSAATCLLLVLRGWKMVSDASRGLKRGIRRMKRRLESERSLNESPRRPRRGAVSE
jgi:hypothetical protein